MTQHFISTPATETTCPRCRTRTIAALDEGIPTRVDATPLPSRDAEIAALLNGQWTYVLTSNRHLAIRDATRISGNTLRGTIHAEHRCNGPQQLTLDELIGEQ